MFGSGVLIGMVRTAVHHLQILRGPVHRLRMFVVFAAVRGVAAIRAPSGALIVSIATAGAATEDFVFPQDRVSVLFSGDASGG